MQTVYLLVSGLGAVRLGQSSDKAKPDCFLTLPAGSRLAVDGRSSIPGLIDVIADGVRYAVFRIDLEARAQLRATAAA
jgi:hypothetical protein